MALDEIFHSSLKDSLWNNINNKFIRGLQTSIENLLQYRWSRNRALIREIDWRDFRFDLLAGIKFHINYIICSPVL